MPHFKNFNLRHNVIYLEKSVFFYLETKKKFLYLNFKKKYYYYYKFILKFIHIKINLEVPIWLYES